MTLPPPPRPLTSRIRWRATVEPRVRGWWVATLAILLLAVYFCSRQVVTWRATNRLLDEGLAVEAVVESAGTIKVPRARVDAESFVDLSYGVDGVDYRVSGTLPGRTEPIVIKDRVTIHVDKTDPKVWTGLARPASLGAALAALWTLLPLALLGVAAGVWARSRVLRLYRDGAQATGTVEDVRQTALAPGSRLVRCALDDPRDPRIYGVYVPRTLTGAAPMPGDPIDLLHLGPGKVAAVEWFV